MLDYLLIGGGLANGLLALELAARQPRASLLVVERSAILGQGHTWSFHARDVSASMAERLAPAVAATLPATEISFPALRRAMAGSYHVITADKFDQSVRRVAEVCRGEALAVSPHQVTLRDGRTLEAELVVDARGPARSTVGAAGYQKFVGLELRTHRPHGRTRALIMDAAVEQLDGLRFFYVLPLAGDVVLVEDTCYSDSPELDVPALRARIVAYAEAAGLEIAEVLREELGVLPLPLAVPPPSPAMRGLVTLGYQGGFLHPTTGYSLPVAARVAERLAAIPAAAFPTAGWAELVAAHRRQVRFATYLNRLLFVACPPADRWRVLARFYTLPEDTIARFYALDTRATDRLRVLCGRPPRGVSVGAALGAIREPRPSTPPGRDA